MDILQQAVQGFTFYSLSECTHQQLLSHSKFPVNIYHRTLTNQIFVVKELPYNQNLIRIYRLLKDSQTLNIVGVCGLSKLFYLSKQKDDKKTNKRILVQSQSYIKQKPYYESKNVYLLLWMQKYQKNLVDYIQERRKKLSPFSTNQIKSFLFQLLTTLRILQKKGIAHRDIKPQNILYQDGRYFLCDFDEAMLTKWGKIEKQPQQIFKQLQYTTILYSTPKFLRFLKSIQQENFNQKYFDPFKLDVYSFGLTFLYICSLGKFSIDDRNLYVYNQNGNHEQFIEEERRKYVKKDSELKVFNSILKLMLQEDEYKRDDFETLNQKIIQLLGIATQSQQSFTTKSRKMRRQKRQKLKKSRGNGFKCGKLKVSEKFLLYVLTVTVLIYFFLLIF